MNIKKTLGSLIIALVIGGISYPAFLFINATGGQFATKVLIVFGTLGLLFFIASIALIRITKKQVITFSPHKMCIFNYHESNQPIDYH